VRAATANKTSISADDTADSLLFSGNKTPASAKAIEFKAKVDINIKPAINSLTIIFNEYPLGWRLDILL